MLRSRVIPCLLIENGDLVKTVNFKDGRYVGDPLNAVRIFNEKEVDELMVLDISATASGAEPDFGLITDMAEQCRMPLCYGGGVKRLDQAQRIVNSGVEKIALSSAFVERPELAAELSEALGQQSVIGVIDVKATRKGYEVFTHNGTRATGLDPFELARTLEAQGVGELVFNAIDRDGAMTGYDLDLCRQARAAVATPLTFLGGAGGVDDLRGLIGEFQIIGAGAGSLFVFKGPLKAVLISYPKL